MSVSFLILCAFSCELSFFAHFCCSFYYYAFSFSLFLFLPLLQYARIHKYNVYSLFLHQPQIVCSIQSNHFDWKIAAWNGLNCLQADIFHFFVWHDIQCKLFGFHIEELYFISSFSWLPTTDKLYIIRSPKYRTMHSRALCIDRLFLTQKTEFNAKIDQLHRSNV